MLHVYMLRMQVGASLCPMKPIPIDVVGKNPQMQPFSTCSKQIFYGFNVRFGMYSLKNKYNTF